MNRVVSFFLPTLEGGGAEKCMFILAKGLAQRNLEVNLVLSNAEGPYVDEARTALNLVDLGTRSNLKSIPRLIRYIQKARPDIVIAALEHANVAALIARRASGVDLRLAVTTHTIVSMALRSSPRVTSRLIVPLMRLLYPSADFVIAVSTAVASDLAAITRLPASSIRVIHNPVVTSEILALSHAPVDTTWFDPEAPPVVISVGNLWTRKDHETLIRALGIVRRERPVRLVILGEGPERPFLGQLTKRLGLEADVMMPGFAANPYSWIARSAVFALPSRWEGFGNVLVEAMALGVTPVATDCPGGPKEILDNGRFGILTPVGDAPAMANAIVRSLDQPLNPEQLRQRASNFSVDNAVERYLELVVNPGT